jgi:transposase
MFSLHIVFEGIKNVRFDMKKKKFIVCFTAVLILITVFSVTLLTGSEAENHISINGIPQEIEMMQGVTGNNDSPLVKMTTSEDLQRIYDSMDPITGQPTYLPPVMVKLSEDEEYQVAERCTLTCVIDENTSYDLKFKYVVRDGKKILIHGGEVYSSFEIPNSDNYAIACGGLIYLLDLNEGTLVMYNSKEAGGYSFYTYNKTIYRKVWASKPSFNPSGTKMLYYTERANNEVGSIWVMDNETKTEKPIPNTTAYNRVLQWVNDDVAYIKTAYEVLRIDTSKYTSQSIYSDNGNPLCDTVLSYPYMFVSDLKGSRIYNLEDGSIREYDDSRYSHCAAAVSGFGNMALLVYGMPKENIGTYREAVVLDLATGKDCVISVNEKDIIGLFLPYNDVKAKLDVQIDGNTYNQVSYFIEYSSLVFD